MIYVTEQPPEWRIESQEGSRPKLYLRCGESKRGWAVARVPLASREPVEHEMAVMPGKWLLFADQAHLASAFRGVRGQRNRLLAATDYLMRSDYPISEADRAAVAAYSQALRDVPEQEGYPYDVTWPALPAVMQMKGDDPDEP